MKRYLIVSRTYFLKSLLVRTTVGLILALSLLLACNKRVENLPGMGNNGDPGNCSSVPKSFATDVRPVIEAFCANGAGCHGLGSNVGPGPLITYTQIFNARTSIRSEVASGRMPPNGGLLQVHRNTIICWIDDGAENN